MISRRTRLEISAAIALSLAAHYALAVVAADGELPVLIEGGAPAQIAAVGNSFSDFAAGHDVPEPSTETPIEPIEPVTAVEPPVMPAVQPVVTPVEALEAETETARAPMPEILTGTDTEMALVSPEISEAPTPEIAAIAPAEVSETVEAQPDSPTVPLPQRRPARPEDEQNLADAREAIERAREERARVERERAAEARRREQARREQQRAARGNAEQDARTGQADGQTQARASAAGRRESDRASRAGNAAASNYPGKVYAKIRRTRQRPTDGRGTARIRFSITASGGLGSIRVASSSGSAAIDRAALDHIRRSAPFPRPPAGAQRNFVIPVRVQ